MGDVSANCSPGHLDSPFGPPNNSGVENFPPPWAQPNRHGKTMSTSRQKDRGVWPVVGNDKRTAYWPRGPWHRLLAYEWRPIKYVRLDTLQAERINSFAKCQDYDGEARNKSNFADHCQWSWDLRKAWRHDPLLIIASPIILWSIWNSEQMSTDIMNTEKFPLLGLVHSNFPKDLFSL
jgi:hypothetical protein